MLKRIPLTLAAVFLLGACQSPDRSVEDWDSVPKPKHPTAHGISLNHDVLFEAERDVMPATERARLDAFLAKAVKRGARVSVRKGQGPLADQRRERVRVHLALKQLESTQTDDGAALPGNAVRVTVRRSVVILPECPDWSERPGRTFNNAVSSNFGCANATNLGLMVANPADLNGGRPLDPADGTVSAAAVERYRKGETKALAPEDVGVTQSQQKTGEGE